MGPAFEYYALRPVVCTDQLQALMRCKRWSRYQALLRVLVTIEKDTVTVRYQCLSEEHARKQLGSFKDLCTREGLEYKERVDET